MMNQNKLHRMGNSWGLALICTILVIGFVDQFYRHDLPCPLCLLQRAGFIAVGLCLCMNLKKGIHTTHYGLMLLAALVGFATAIHQVFLHIAPGDLGYGHLVFGFHLYIWSAIAFILIMLLIGMAMLFEDGFSEQQQKLNRNELALMAIFLVLILANGISTFVECGFLICPSDPEHYQLLN